MKRWVIGLAAVVVLFGARRVEGSVIYFTTASNKSVQSVREDGTGLQTLLSLDRPGRAMAVNPLTGQLFFSTSDSGTYRANLDGSGLQLLSMESPRDLELNLGASLLYYSFGNIARSNLDGSGFETLLPPNTPGVTSLAIDAQNGYLFITDSGENNIFRTDLDGQNKQTLISFATNVDLEDIEVDSVGGKIYWTDHLTNKLQRANLDGTGIEDLILGLAPTSAFGRRLALDVGGGKVYWSTPGSPFGANNPGGIYRANLDGSGIELVLAHDGDIHGLDFGPGPSQPNVIPEPSTFAIWSALGIVGAVIGWRRERRGAA